MTLFYGGVSYRRFYRKSRTLLTVRVALGEEAGRHHQMKGDLWLNRAIRLAVKAFDEPFDYETDSLQKSLLQQLHERNPEADVWKLFRPASSHPESLPQHLLDRVPLPAEGGAFTPQNRVDGQRIQIPDHVHELVSDANLQVAFQKGVE